MGTYRFECKSCKVTYEEMVAWDETGKWKGVKCPDCGSKKKLKLATSCSFQFENPIGTDKWCSDSTGHDFRYKYNEPNVRKQRETAEKKSHMGSSKEIYRQINDLNVDKNFDFSKI